MRHPPTGYTGCCRNCSQHNRTLMGKVVMVVQKVLVMVLVKEREQVAQKEAASCEALQELCNPGIPEAFRERVFVIVRLDALDPHFEHLAY